MNNPSSTCSTCSTSTCSTCTCTYSTSTCSTYTYTCRCTCTYIYTCISYMYSTCKWTVSFVSVYPSLIVVYTCTFLCFNERILITASPTASDHKKYDHTVIKGGEYIPEYTCIYYTCMYMYVHCTCTYTHDCHYDIHILILGREIC